MTQEQADAKEIEVAQYLFKVAEPAEWDDAPAFAREIYVRHASEIIAMVSASLSTPISEEA